MNADAPYRTLAASGASELVIERSRFLGRAEPVDSVETALEIVAQLQREHHSARHVCFGLRVGRGSQIVDRWNDDGEPSRTGGFPLWQLLEGEDLTNALIAVVRYFGGVKLGTGGLSRAYRAAGREAQSVAGVLEVWPEVQLDVELGYDMVARLDHLLADLEGVRVAEREFAEAVRYELVVRCVRLDAVRARLAELLQRAPESFDAR